MSCLTGSASSAADVVTFEASKEPFDSHPSMKIRVEALDAGEGEGMMSGKRISEPNGFAAVKQGERAVRWAS